MSEQLSDKGIRYLSAAIGCIGVAFMVYLSKLHYSGAESSVCDLSEGVSCSAVNTSAFSELLGVPLSVMGILFFLAVIAMMLYRGWPGRYRDTLLFSVFSLVFGLYLSGVELFVLDTICLFCELSKVLMLALIVLSVVGARRTKERINGGPVAAAVIVGLLFSVGAYMLQREPVFQDDTDPVALAECLTEKEVVMYGAYWCPNCKRQKKMFGDAVALIHEVECDPRGENAEAERCVERDIAKTPTWIEEPGGEEVSRYTGALPLAELAETFGCSQ